VPAIELRHLRYFVALSEELHFGRAAERLHMAQPPLSQAIRKLEAALGVELFKRTSRVVTITEPGRVLAEHARKLLASFELAIAEARRAGGAVAGLRIACVPYVPIARLLRFVGVLAERDPSAAPELSTWAGPAQARLLMSGELDFGIFFDVGDYDGIATEPLFAGEQVAAFVAADHRLAANPLVTPADLRDEILVTLKRSLNTVFYDRFVILAGEVGYRFERVREVSGETARDLLLHVAANHGVALAPASLKEVADPGSAVIRCSLDPSFTMPDTVLAWRAGPPQHPDSTLTVVREIARELYAESMEEGGAESSRA
jgi:DNA-binding transcriptional LysR family regulator